MPLDFRLLSIFIRMPAFQVLTNLEIELQERLARLHPQGQVDSSPNISQVPTINPTCSHRIALLVVAVVVPLLQLMSQ